MKANAVPPMSIYYPSLEERVLGPILRRQAAAEGDRVYMRFGADAFTFAETDRRVRAIARAMAARGVKRGGYVALLLPNGTEFVLAWYAASVLGAAFLPINPHYKGFMLEHPLDETGCRALVVHRDLLGNLAGTEEKVRRQIDWVAVVGGTSGAQLPAGPKEYLDFADLGIDEGPDPEAECDFRDIHSAMYTSGTTGPSKGVLISNAQFFSSACVFLRALALTREDVLYTNLPLFHGLASRLGALPAMMVGAELVIGERFSASRFWREVTDSNATVAHTIFTLPEMLKAQPPGPYDRAHRLRAMYNSHHDPAFEERFNVRLVEAYGLTETGLMVYTPYPERRQGSAGRLHEDYEAQIVDERDMPVPVGQPGEVVVRPKLPWIMMQGYLHRPEATVEAWRNLWFHTGDVMRMDADGYFYFVDRKKDRIRRKGENISSWDVEHYVTSHPAVAECTALPHPADVGEDEVRVVLVAKPGTGLTPEALMDWLVERMPAFMLPRYLEFVDAIPRSPTNKVEKYKLVAAGLGAGAWDRVAAGRPTPDSRRGGRRHRT